MSVDFPYLYKEASSPVKIVTWADGTEDEIAAMLAAADAGQINLSDYWSVGDERTVHLDAMTAGDAFPQASEAQDVILVLMDTGAQSGYVDVNDNPVNFVVGQKNCLNGSGLKGYCRMNNTYTSSGSWRECKLRADLNNKYYNALPADFRNLLKQFKVVTAKYYYGDTNEISNDYVSLFAEKEIFGSRTYSNSTEASALKQITYYTTSANRLKNRGENLSDYALRSPTQDYANEWVYVKGDATPMSGTATQFNGTAPFMCI